MPGSKGLVFSRGGSSFLVKHWKIAMLFLMVFLPFERFASSQEVGEAAEKVLTQGKYPWFDPATKDVRSVPLPLRPPSGVSDRGAIPPHTPSSWTPANRGGGGGGAVTASDMSWLNFFTWFMIAVVIAVVVSLIIFAFFKLESQKKESKLASTRRSLKESIEQLPFQVDDPSGDFQSMAAQAYQRGDFRRAIILLFSHLLVTLDQSTLIRLRKGKTNRQYLNELSARESLVGYFRQVMESFESVFFGDHEISKADFEASWFRLGNFQTDVDTIESSHLQASEVAR